MRAAPGPWGRGSRRRGPTPRRCTQAGGTWLTTTEPGPTPTVPAPAGSPDQVSWTVVSSTAKARSGAAPSGTSGRTEGARQGRTEAFGQRDGDVEQLFDLGDPPGGDGPAALGEERMGPGGHRPVGHGGQPLEDAVHEVAGEALDQGVVVLLDP